jgi:hypothetical protein
MQPKTQSHARCQPEQISPRVGPVALLAEIAEQHERLYKCHVGVLKQRLIFAEGDGAVVQIVFQFAVATTAEAPCSQGEYCVKQSLPRRAVGSREELGMLCHEGCFMNEWI